MSTWTTSPNRAGWLRPKYVLWAFVFLMMAYVLNHNERFLIDRSHPVWRHYQPFKWWLLPHGLTAACALLLGPLQFSDRLRQRYTKFHRIVGRIYVTGAIIGGPLGAYIQYFEERMGGPRSFTIAGIVDAFLLATTTLIAFYFAMQRKIPQHRQWMTRSYAVAIVFLEVRVITGLAGWDNDLKIIETVVWMCLGMSLLLADVVIQWQEVRRSRPLAARAQAAD